ncbi:TPA: ArdC family protein [Legionella pneumophila]|nr:DUF1738 domain-containing protein [Legionella pneumophila]
MKSYQEFCALNARRLFAIIEKHGGLLQWKKEWSGEGLNALPQSINGIYRGGNLFSLFFAQMEKGFKSNQWLTFNQIKKGGGQVLNGSKAEEIYFWSLKDQIELNQKTNESEKKSSFIFKTYYVFNLEQTTLFKKEGGQNEQFQCNQLLNYIKPSISHFGNHAFYTPVNDTIVLPHREQFTDKAAYEATLLHELTHWTGVEYRLNRESLKAYGTEKGRAEEELVAEFGAFFLCAFFKIKSDIENHASYVNSWKTLLNEKEIMRATNMAAKAFHYLVEPLQKEQAQIAA